TRRSGLTRAGLQRAASVRAGLEQGAGGRAAAQALRIGPDVKEAVSALSAALAKDADAGVRAASDALGGIGPAAKEGSTVEKRVPRKISPHRGWGAIIQILGGTRGSVRLSRRSSFNLVRGSCGQLKF